MNVKIFPSKINGIIAAPPSKSVTHRSIITAALASGESTITNILISDDTIATIKALKLLGVRIEQKGNTLLILGTNGKLTAPKGTIFLGNSGSSMRMLAAVCALAKGETILTGEKRLCERPIGDLLTALSAMGISAQSIHNNGCPPIKIKGGLLTGGNVHVKGDVSSQFITALLLVAPFTQKPMTITVDGELKSKPYVLLTIDIMKTFNVSVTNNNFKIFTIENFSVYQAKNYIVEGDYSSGSYFFAAAAITKGNVSVANLNTESAQGDKFFLEILKNMGAKVEKNTSGFTVSNTNDLNGVDIDMNDHPDIVQTVAIVAAFAKGTTRLTNISHLKHKESDRIEATAQELKKMGIDVLYDNNSLRITGGKPKGAIIETHNDHRIAMSFSVAGLAADGETIIQNAEVTNKSYPNFWADLEKIGGKTEYI